MKRLITISLIVISALAVTATSAKAQSAACGPHVRQMLQGTWAMTCTGFTDFSRVNPNVPPNTLVPFAALGHTTINADGNGAGKSIFDIAGMLRHVELEGTFGVNPDCTGELDYTVRAHDPELVMPGKASVMYLPRELEFHTLILAPGDVITCEYKKMYNALPPT